MLGFENYASESLASKQLCSLGRREFECSALELTRMAPNIEAVSKLTEEGPPPPLGLSAQKAQ